MPSKVIVNSLCWYLAQYVQISFGGSCGKLLNAKPQESQGAADGYRLRKLEAESKFSRELTVEAIGRAVPMSEIKASLEAEERETSENAS